jgi:hypothetical protein
MAKVKIQGNASGTGVLTVTAPNTSTDRTITLPDSTGTLATTADVPSSITDNGDATAITIDSSERVGIGTGSPSEPLHVAGSGNSTKIRIQNTKSGTTTGAELEMVSEDGTWQLGQGRGSLHDGDDEDFHIYNSGTKLWIKKTNGNVYIPSGNLVLGSGLTIGGTGAANTLDDYEEGTWSPTITCETSGSYSLQGGADLAAYTKIGRVVTVQGGLSVLGESSPSGNLRITLPFTAFTGTDDTDYCMGNAALANHGSTIDVQSLNAFTYGGAYFYIWGVNPDGTSRYIKHTDVDTNWQVYFNFTYIAA